MECERNLWKIPLPFSVEEGINLVNCTVKDNMYNNSCFRTKGYKTGWQMNSQLEWQVSKLDWQIRHLGQPVRQTTKEGPDLSHLLLEMSPGRWKCSRKFQRS